MKKEYCGLPMRIAHTGVTQFAPENSLEAFTKADVDMFESMGIRVFSNLGDYPEWWQQICDMGVAGFKTNYPDAYTEWWLSAH